MTTSIGLLCDDVVCSMQLQKRGNLVVLVGPAADQTVLYDRY